MPAKISGSVLCLFFLISASQHNVQAGVIQASVRATLNSSSDGTSILTYSGDSSGLSPLLVARSESDNRYVEATLDSNSLFARSEGKGTGVFDVPGAEALLQSTIDFQNTPELQALMDANGGQPIDMVAKFYMEFDLLSLLPGDGVFRQSETRTTAGISSETNLNGTTIVNDGSAWATLSAGNTAFDGTVINTDGLLTPSLIGTGPFEVFVPFKVSNAAPDGLSTIFRMRVNSESLSLGDLKVASQARIFYPNFDDIFLASGESATSMGLSFELNPVPQLAEVPEPSTLALAAIGALGLVFGRTRKRMRNAA